MARRKLTAAEIDSRQQSLKNKAINFYNQHGKSPTVADIDPNEVLTVYPTWNDFLLNCGLEINRLIGIENELLVQQCQALAAELGRTPTVCEFDRNNDTHCSYTVIQHFGSWNAFLKECGLSVNRVTGVTKEELRWHILYLAQLYKKAPTKAKFNKYAKENGLCSSMVIQRYWGTYTNCLIDCGLRPNVCK